MITPNVNKKEYSVFFNNFSKSNISVNIDFNTITVSKLKEKTLKAFEKNNDFEQLKKVFKEIFKEDFDISKFHLIYSGHILKDSDKISSFIHKNCKSLKFYYKKN